MEKTLEEKKELAAKVIAALKKEYPDAGCTLDYNEAWKLLVSVRLAAQCTDARVNVVVQDLYKKFPDVKALAEADVDEIEEIVRPCGLGRSKARDISACMKILYEQYHGNVPDDFDALFRLRRDRPDFRVMIDHDVEISFFSVDESGDGSLAKLPAGKNISGFKRFALKHLPFRATVFEHFAASFKTRCTYFAQRAALWCRCCLDGP